MMNNTMQILGQINDFAHRYKGNPEDEVKKAIQQTGISQQELNDLQLKANELYSFAKNMGLMK